MTAGRDAAAERVRTSKFLSLVLRHRPESIGITLDAEGWTDLDLLVERANAAGSRLSRSAVEEVVRTNDKQRFALSSDGRLIRAQQGHSTSAVSLTFELAEPPPLLFHGTADRNVPSIREHGLRPGGRHHVHLSADRSTALAVGARHGKAVVLLIGSDRMRRHGHSFYRSGNGVWLVDRVPPDSILEWDLDGPAGKPEATDQLVLLEPWFVPDCEDRSAFETELRREVAPGHTLFGRSEPAWLIARRCDEDDFAFLLADGSVACVHLSFSSGPDSPPWPSTAMFADLDDWTENCMLPEHEEWPPDSPASDG